MDKLMTLIKAHSDQAEVYSLNQTQNILEFEDNRLKDIRSTMQGGIALRLIKERKLGFAYTKNVTDPQELVANALDSLRGGVSATFDFPLTPTVPELDTYDPMITQATNTALAEECQRISSFLEKKTKNQVNITASTAINEIRIINTAGTDVSTDASYYAISVSIIYPGSATGIHKSFVTKSFHKLDDAELDMLAHLYNQGKNEQVASGGRIKVLFMPQAMYTLIWRLQSATSGEALYHKQSPMADRLGEKVFDEKLTIIDNPIDDTKPGARAFDDEATPCRKVSIVEQGVLKNYYHDLYYAAKMKTDPTGHGFKDSRWPGDKISIKPVPSLQHVTIEPGEGSFEQLIRSMDRGIIVCGALGAHSGNIPNGDFSIGLSPGLYVEQGEIRGRIKDAMIAGNIYDVMNHVVGIEDKVHAAYTGYYPAVLFDDVSVATKK
jgi:PmbA protein